MAIRLLGSSKSGNCLKPKWILDLLSISYEWIETDSFDGSTRTPEFLALNPAGQVPAVILEDGRLLAQSNAMMVHFAEGSDLIPGDAYDRAKMFEWLFWEQYSHEPQIAVRIARKHYLGKRDDELDPSLLAKGQRRFGAHGAAAETDAIPGGRTSSRSPTSRWSPTRAKLISVASTLMTTLP